MSERYAVEWFVPGTRSGDGRPLNGRRFITATSPGHAWDEFAGRRDPLDEVVVRVMLADDLRDVPPLLDILDAIGVGLARG